MDEIRADYQHLEQLASKFENQSQAIQEMLQRVNGGMQKLKEAWVGKGSDAFFNDMESEVVPASQRLHDVLSQAGQTTKQIAQIMKQGEEEASSRFKQ